MSSTPSARCFVAMPFRTELTYFYLFMRHLLEQRWSFHVERGDDEILTIPMLEKVRQQVSRADLIIADITGSNPNVLYEIGYAHASNKPVLLITQDPPEKAPVDVRQFECIVYDLARHDDFVARFERAVNSHFGVRYDVLYAKGLEILDRFNMAVGAAYEANTRDEFVMRLLGGRTKFVAPAQEELLAELILPKIIKDFGDAGVLKHYTAWISAQSGGGGDAA